MISKKQSIEILNGGIFCHVEFCTAGMDANHECNRKSVLDRLQFCCQEVVPCIDFVCDDEFVDGILFGVYRDHFVLLPNLLEFFVKVTLEPCHVNRGAAQHTCVVGDSDRLEFCENASHAEDECRDESCFDDAFEIHCLIPFLEGECGLENVAGVVSSVSSVFNIGEQGQSHVRIDCVGAACPERNIGGTCSGCFFALNFCVCQLA